MPSPPGILFSFVGDVTRDSRILRMARTLASRYAVTILSLSDREKSCTVDDIRVFQSPYKDPGSLRRSLTAFWREGVRIASDLRADLFIASDLYSLPIASRAARMQSKPLLYDSRELYSSIAALKTRTMTQFFWKIVERRHASRAAAIMTVNESIAERLRQRYAGQAIVTVHNYPSWTAGTKTNMLRERLSISPDQTLLLSQGGLQAGRGSIPMIEALALLENHRLVFLGSGSFEQEILQHAIRTGVADRVYVLADVASDELRSYTASADIGLCLIENLGESYYLSLPNKLFEYIAAGVPVVGSRFPEIDGIIAPDGIGLSVDPGSPGAIAEAIGRLHPSGECHGQCVRNCLTARAKYQWEREEGALLTLVDRVLAQ